jgi:hypothetical protein
MPAEYYIDPHAPAPLFNHPWGGRGLFRDPERGAMRRLPDPNHWRLVQDRVLGMPDPVVYGRNLRRRDGKYLMQPKTAPYGPPAWRLPTRL